MIRWLRSLFQSSDAPSLEMGVRWDGKVVRVRAIRVVGLRLLVNRCDGRGSGTVTRGQAVDPAHFCMVWKHLGGAPVCWPDGTPVDDSLV